MKFKIKWGGLYYYRPGYNDWNEFRPWWAVFRFAVHKLGIHWWQKYSNGVQITHKQCWVCGDIKE